ncbi:hypothetical protein M406DRAFT_68751 [Cryphonectria parasitica EP155]|uniref:Uncharacterized protein n=1 Tax=Cryphonectria parasitica (strain ATCC 38755 / EP155) TaxID=660469 RepID=A0A9P4Y4N1_CRYP1|nr:uncharacterized protein M406DRAFT_68751 [Cryphonectria parasitica EP155]KAF3766405.1 hypothetical protein M406DRAFT_68751 [Cryphonectria parasitica EP155]
MARDYWVESSPSGRPRFVKTSHLRRSNTHDGSQSSRSRRVDFLDVTRAEYDSLRQANEDLLRENYTYKTNWQSCDAEVRRLRGVVPTLEAEVRTLDYENQQLRGRLEESEKYTGGGYHESRHREDEVRRLRYKNTKLRDENETLRARMGRFERDLRDGLSDRARRLSEDLGMWKRRYSKLDDDLERLYHKLDSVEKRNRRLESMNESLARQDRKLRQDVDYYQSILRRHGITR